MPEKKSQWTRPGAIDQDEADRGTAATNPVLVVAPERDPAVAEREGGHAPVQDAEEARDTRSPAEIEADIDRTREHLSETLDELSERLSPRELAQRGGRRVKAQFVEEQTGRLRPARIAVALGLLGSAASVVAGMRRLRSQQAR